MKRKLLPFAAAICTLTVTATAATLEEVQSRGMLRCGINGTVPGFSAPDDKGRMRGIDADICYAIATVVLGDRDKVQFIPLTAKERFSALTSGEIDVLSRNTTHTLQRDARLGVNFTYYNFIDGQGFMVKKDIGVQNATQLDGARVCVQAGTTTELNLADYFRARNMKFTPKGYDTAAQTREAYEGGACDVLTSDKSQLAALRSEMKNPAESIILPETISKEPLGPAVRQGDDIWLNLVKWVLFAMINAEEFGVDSTNVKEMAQSPDPRIKRLLGTEGEMCVAIHTALPADCFYDMISQVGNYGEIYAANLGADTPLELHRAGSVNDLWTRGGLLYAPPLR
jgi:general L-amino acid transport system substrate-binding protein